MSKVYIVVKAGLVQNVYADVGNLEVEIIDFDTTDLEEQDAAFDRLAEVRASNYLRYQA